MPEKSYAFRLRYTLSPRDTVNCFESSLKLPTTESDYEVKLKANSDKTIEASGSLVLHGAGWATPEEAEHFGHFYADVLARTCARLKLGVDFGDRAAKGGWLAKEVSDDFSQRTGRLMLTDVHGLMIYERTNPPVLHSSEPVSLVQGINLDRFLSVYDSALGRPREISKEERTALLLFNASFFPNSPDGRFMLLMMGIEALMKKQEQPDKIKAIIRGFISAVDENPDLGTTERNDLKSILGNLLKESFRQAGRRLVEKKLGARKYKEMSAREFFEYCYDLRSKLVHGKVPLPSRDEVSVAAVKLEAMLSDLLSTDLLDVGPQP
ncbi:MAG: hypothetical protein A2162_02265 [Deltaproteobacteria bacterium RBG_13_52_11b]|nr:MAG: hypothetical protein A2162_02265 [Deltaproteobacteria bacterium RBG_13_52_11b]